MATQASPETTGTTGARVHAHVSDAIASKGRGLTLFILTATYFFSYMDRQILAILQENIKADLQLSDTQLGLLSGLAFAIFYATLGIPVARLADKTSRKGIIAAALTLWSLMTALCGIAQNFWQLLLFRIGVGVGEAGSSPPSHSIIADLYPPEKRASAMALYSLGVTLGGASGTAIGGTIAYFYGWRVAMFAVGLPGIALALIVLWLVKEPRRGMSDVDLVASSGAMPSVGASFSAMWQNVAARHLVVAVTLTSMIGYGHGAWGPSFMQRLLDIPITSISWYIAPAAAVLGTISGIGGGKLADWLAKRNGLYAQSWMIAVLKTIALPFSLAFYFVPIQEVALTGYFLSILFQGSYLGPTFALIQGLAPLRMRAMWAAVTLFVINLVGLGLGPTLAGLISDGLRPIAGVESLRWSMVLFSLATPWAIFHYWRAGVALKAQLGSVERKAAQHN